MTGILRQVRHLRHDGRDRDHVGRVLHELAGVAVVGMIVVGPMREDQVGLEGADQADDLAAVFERRQAVRRRGWSKTS